ncbi:hypothetical protein BM1_03924 [Bipolaris maydis]|nr:hypothetical protein BM1_03924 [Bipolaris maydis]
MQTRTHEQTYAKMQTTVALRPKIFTSSALNCHTHYKTTNRPAFAMQSRRSSRATSRKNYAGMIVAGNDAHLDPTADDSSESDPESASDEALSNTIKDRIQTS